MLRRRHRQALSGSARRASGRPTSAPGSRGPARRARRPPGPLPEAHERHRAATGPPSRSSLLRRVGVGVEPGGHRRAGTERCSIPKREAVGADDRRGPAMPDQQAGAPMATRPRSHPCATPIPIPAVARRTVALFTAWGSARRYPGHGSFYGTGPCAPASWPGVPQTAHSTQSGSVPWPIPPGCRSLPRRRCADLSTTCALLSGTGWFMQLDRVRVLAAYDDGVSGGPRPRLRHAASPARVLRVNHGRLGTKCGRAMLSSRKGPSS